VHEKQKLHQIELGATMFDIMVKNALETINIRISTKQNGLKLEEKHKNTYYGVKSFRRKAF